MVTWGFKAYHSFAMKWKVMKVWLIFLNISHLIEVATFGLRF